MRFLVNENIPGDAVSALVAAGHDVVWIRVAAPGSVDEDVLAWAVREGRVLVTFDQALASLHGAPACQHPVALCFSELRCQVPRVSVRPG